MDNEKGGPRTMWFDEKAGTEGEEEQAPKDNKYRWGELSNCQAVKEAASRWRDYSSQSMQESFRAKDLT